MRRSISLGLAALGSIVAISAGVAIADPDTSTAPKSGSTETQPSEAAKPAFPAIKKKNLYAKTDLRGKQAPKFEVEKWLTKEPSREGKVVLIDFWATWCPPCRALIPELNELQTKFKDELVVIGVSDEKSDKVLPFMEKTKVEYSMAVDTASKMKNTLAVEGIPHVLIIDSTGVVRWQGWPQNPEERLNETIVKQIIDADKAQRAAAKK